MTILHGYVEWLCGLQFECIPKPAAVAARNAVFDTVAAILSGVNEPASRTILRYKTTDGAPGPATVVGTTYRLSPASAALVNGTMGHALDYDDVLMSMRSHPSVVLVPAVLAVGEAQKSSGAEVLTAYLAGLEIVDKLGLLVGYAQVANGWHTTSTLGALGAAAAAGRLLKLPERQMRMAVGIAASMAGGLQKNFGTMTKPMHAGLAAHSGVMAAMLAADGFTASEDVLEGKRSYLEVLVAKAEPARMLCFGSPFAVISPGLHVKRYPCCYATHRAIDAVFNLKSEYPGLDVNQIVSVTCLGPASAFNALIHDSPTNGLEGKFSMPYTVAAAFLDGRVSIHSFQDEMVRREAVRSFMAKVCKVEDPALSLTGPDGSDRRFTEVTVTMGDGRILKNKVVRLKGSAEVPLSDQELAEKFVECSTEVLSDGQRDAALGIFRRLEVLDDISSLMENLRAAR